MSEELRPLPPGSARLDQFLQLECSEGAFDSEGAFTVDWASALEKTAHFSLERPSAWILKVVQAAVGLRATTINGHVLRHGARLEIRLPEDGPSWNQVRSSVIEPDREAPRALHDLALGLWPLTRGPERDFQLQATAVGSRFGKEYPWLRWSAGAFSVNSKNVGDGACSELELWVNRPPASLLSRVARMFGGGSYFLDEMEELRHLAYLLPIDNHIDGMSSHHFLRAQTGVKGVARGLGCGYPNPFLWGFCAGQELPELPIHPRWQEFAYHIKSGGDYEPAQKWLALDLWGDRPGALWALSFDFTMMGARRACERSEIRWLRSGVIVDQTPFPELEGLTLGAVLHLSAEGLATDLGGMRLRPEETAFLERRKAGLRALLGGLVVEEVRSKLFNWKLPHRTVEACLKQVETLANRLRHESGSTT